MQKTRRFSVTFSTFFIAILLSVYVLGVAPISTHAESAGWALSFDGVNDYAVLNKTAYIFHANWKTEKTVNLWVRPNGPGAVCPNNNVAWCDAVFGDRPRWWGISRGIVNGQDRIWVWNVATGYNIVGIEYTPNEWVNIAMVHTGGMLYGYKNGVEAGSIPSGPTQQPNTNALPTLQIGGVINNSSRVWTFKGEIDEVRLWNRGLTPAEVSADMYHSLTGSEPFLAAYYKMSDGQGSFLTDDSLNSWNGVLYDGGGIVPPNGAPPAWVVSDAFNNPGVTATPTASFTPAVPTATFTPTFTAAPPTNTPTPTNTVVVPTNTNTPTATNTSAVPTNTPTATFTPVTPTETATPTNTQPPIDTATPTIPSPAGQIFADSFESGDFSAWSDSATDSGDLSVSPAAAMDGALGMAALINSTNPIYVRDDLPTAETHYRAAFWFDVNGLSMAERNHHIIFQGYDAGNSFVLRIEFQRQTGQYWVRAATLTDANTWMYTPWTALSDQPHHLEIDWAASTGPGQNNGSISLWLDGGLTGTTSGFDNDGRTIEQVRLGPVSGIDGATTGTYYFDGFTSSR